MHNILSKHLKVNFFPNKLYIVLTSKPSSLIYLHDTISYFHKIYQHEFIQLLLSNLCIISAIVTALLLLSQIGFNSK